MVLPLAALSAASPFLSKIGGLLGGGTTSKSSSNSTVSSSINAIVQNTIGGTGAPQSGGTATASPSSFDNAAAGVPLPSYTGQPLSSANLGVPTSGQTDTGAVDDNTQMYLIGGAVVVAALVYFYM